MSIVTDVDPLRYRRTKIVATLGPASSQPEAIASLIRAGVNVVRLNMSHGDHDGHAQLYRRVREVASQLGEHVAVFADLCGPKNRVGRFRDGEVELHAGERVTLTTRDVLGEPGLIPSQYEGLARDVKAGDTVLLDDGAIELAVEEVRASEVGCRVLQGGTLRSHKGLHLPRVPLSVSSLTAKDREDARFALELGVDLLALSFVRRAEDVLELRSLVTASGGEAGIIAKIERPEALANFSRILAAADAVMVARGDLGVELSPEQVPIAQNQLIAKARLMNRPVIVATQMLESMVERTRPTRAEVSDVYHAVAAGVDAVMLSAETATGRHPVASVAMMARIARQTEAYHLRQRRMPWAGELGVRAEGATPFGDAVAAAAAQLAHSVEARAVIVISGSGMSAVTVSAARPSAPVVAITASPRTARRMNLMWGVIPVVTPEVGVAHPNQLARRVARELELAKPGEFVLLVRGFHSDPAVNSPSITLLTV